ncbi:hypothetical protein [Sulfurimonas sp.]|jgi:cell filamentation protein|uniref:hypothetical protein n=1 Tax=Sulfurimonas sp. TaxID=2022749 RepID=UPI0025D30D6A|nr:hypothetical protein [Sulfurimonas sp.]MCK9472353.1 hypothetical protein [Sulfurimonas sp.]
MTKTKYLLYAFKCKENQKYSYWYETDKKYFKQKKPPVTILKRNQNELSSVNDEDIILNPWNEWDSNNIQKIIADNGVCINYLKSTNNDFIQKQEDLKLLELLIGLKLKKEDNYIQRVHDGYECDYEPMKELLKMKILEEIKSE